MLIILILHVIMPIVIILSAFILHNIHTASVVMLCRYGKYLNTAFHYGELS
jgi:hypothetical protein